jgi:hypothetical protein
MRLAILLSLCISVCVFLLTPLHIFANNAADLATLDVGTALVVGALTAALFTALLSALALAALRFVKPGHVHAALTVVLLFVVITGLLLPLTGEVGQDDVTEAPINWLNLGFAVALTAGLYAAIRMGLSRPVWFGLLVFVGVTTVTSAWSGANALGERSAPDAIATLSSTRNILVITFDALSNPHVLRVLEEDASLRERLADFTVYRHVASSSPATQASLTNLLTGDLDLHNEFGDEHAMMMMAPERRVQNRLAQAGHVVSAYGVYSRATIDAVHRYPDGSLGDRPAQAPLALDLIDYGLARTLTPRAMFARSLLGGLGPDDGSALARRVMQPDVRAADARYVMEITDFARYAEGLHVGTDRPVAHFAHFLFTHFPINFDANCGYRGDDAAWFRAHQNVDGALAQTRCALNQFADLVSAMKRSGAYDNSLIILASDHGYQPKHYDRESIDSFTVRGHPKWGVGRYEPMLFIKGFHQRHDEMAYDDRPAIVGDLARTICIAGQLEGCDSFHGYDLMQPGPLPSDAAYFIHLVRNARSIFRLEGTDSYRMRRTTTLSQSILNLDLEDTVTSPLGCGVDQATIRARRFNNGRSDFRTWAKWRNGDWRFVRVQYPECANGRLEIAVTRSGPQPTEVRVNGQTVRASRVGVGRYVLPVGGLSAGSPITVAVNVGDAESDFRAVRFLQ